MDLIDVIAKRFLPWYLDGPVIHIVEGYKKSTATTLLSFCFFSTSHQSTANLLKYLGYKLDDQHCPYRIYCCLGCASCWMIIAIWRISTITVTLLCHIGDYDSLIIFNYRIH